MSAPDTVWRGRFIHVVKDGAWEYAARNDDIDAAVIVAIDGDDVLLVEQYRIPAGRVCLELPAGLVGDEGEAESVAAAARRELEEETGYRAERIEVLGEFYSSPGMTSERFSVVRASGLTLVGAGEDGITVHRVARGAVAGFVAERRAAGVGIDAKLLLMMGLGEVAGPRFSTHCHPGESRDRSRSSVSFRPLRDPSFRWGDGVLRGDGVVQGDGSAA